jgi:aminoglycoside phosphotransferase (APT) family kinase protein
LQFAGRASLPNVEPINHLLAQHLGALAQYRVPQTLVHGDLHAKNIAVRNGRYLFFDWTDGCVSHPFFDLVVMLRHAAVLPDASAAVPRLRDAYLALWTDYEPMPRLRQAWALAAPLGALHQAVSYQHIVASLEPAARHELDWGVSLWVRQMLQCVP